MAEKFQHFPNFFRFLYTELVYHGPGALLAQDLPGDPTPGIHFLCKGGNTFGFGLKHDAPVIKIFAKTGYCVGRSGTAAGAADLAAQDLCFDILRKAHLTDASFCVGHIVRFASRCKTVGE